MTTLNDRAADAMREAGVTAATDVTGFGSSGTSIGCSSPRGPPPELDAAAVPLLEGVLELADEGVVPGGTERNHAYVRPHVDWGALAEPEQLVLADAQTSGGLLHRGGRRRPHDGIARRAGRAVLLLGEVVRVRPGGCAVRGSVR